MWEILSWTVRTRMDSLIRIFILFWQLRNVGFLIIFFFQRQLSSGQRENPDRASNPCLFFSNLKKSFDYTYRFTACLNKLALSNNNLEWIREKEQEWRRLCSKKDQYKYNKEAFFPQSLEKLCCTPSAFTSLIAQQC